MQRARSPEARTADSQPILALENPDRYDNDQANLEMAMDQFSKPLAEQFEVSAQAMRVG